MVETTTKNYGWTKPELQHSPSTWGGFLNTDLDSIDGIVFANQQGLAPVGSGAMWFSATPPANWLICDGSSLDKTTLVGGVTVYAALFAVLGYTYGGSGNNFNLPNLTGVFPIGSNASNALASKGGASTVTLDATMIPTHAHPITDVAHNHTVNQSVHAHGVNDTTHTHGASEAAHSHGLTAQVLTPNAGGNAGAASGWAFTTQRTDAQQPAITVSPAATGINSTNAVNANISLAASGTGLSTTQNTGGGLSHTNMPPFIAVNFIIRFA
jgi:microcystin-dependent protein